ncbi:hypothetical protein C8F04DRAFT_1230426 [Mycena alexandri]|uniref:Cell wall protein n=1 Tax=Mycena alexandri TaxID=1745969 RepID=A0AAD6TCE1_9AGAR|nr:hypothetical protein C8F04DRAFT_1230426 [Mycena alexandri]
MARILISLVSLVCVCQTLAAPIIARNSSLSSSLECLVPNAQISSALSSLSQINPVFDVSTTGSLFTAEQSLFNVSGLAAVLAGGEPPVGAPADVFSTSQADILQGLTAAQDALKDVQVASSANSNRTTQTLAKVNNALKQAISSLGKDLTDCSKPTASSGSAEQASAAAAAAATVLAGGVTHLPSGSSFGRR